MKPLSAVHFIRWLKFAFQAQPDKLNFFCYDHFRHIYDQFAGVTDFEGKLELLATAGEATQTLDGMLARLKASYPQAEPPPPKPEADLDFMGELARPGGVLREQPFYVNRPDDYKLQKALLRPRGMTATIFAPRQMGKTSLLVRGMEEARAAHYQTVHVDFQGSGSEVLVNADTLLRYLANMLVRKLRLARQEVDLVWSDPLSPYDKLNVLLEDYILPTIPTPLVLAFDEMDGLLQTHFHDDFFSMVRFWFNNRAVNAV
jgi:hypothetical protein